eukprot:m.448265 g.448265  ORF g.448265 m.448265 type:complete len:378 (+) comp19636_c0_seq1:157-1290(+)
MMQHRASSDEHSDGRRGGEDGEDSVWSADTEEAFCEALQLYPPCGRRKIVLGEEGKMYGRNELIALHIFNRTGKIRTRKQVSSHIQVLARKQQRETNHRFEGQSSAQIVTLTMQQKKEMSGGHSARAEAQPRAPERRAAPRFVFGQQQQQRQQQQQLPPPKTKLPLLAFHAYIRYQYSDKHHIFAKIENGAEFESPRLECLDLTQVCDKFPGIRELYREQPSAPMHLVKFWVDLDYDQSPMTQSFFGTTATYTSEEDMRVERSTSVISLGKQVIEKIQVESGTRNGSTLEYCFTDAPMCEYMVKFIEKLRSIESPELVNKVLENFSVVQVLRDEATQEVLSCMAFMFETSMKGYGARHNIYRLYEASAAGGERRFTA